MADLTAKARRAAEWLPTAFEKLDAGLYADTWTVFQLEDEAKDLWGYLHCDLSDRMMIAFCEDRGWQDSQSPTVDNADVNSQELTDEQEAAEVEWHVGSEWAVVNGHTVAIDCGQNVFTWVVFQDGEQGVTARSNPVTPPNTLAEARRQAVEAARALGKEGE